MEGAAGMVIVGCDPSLRHTGLAGLAYGKLVWGMCLSPNTSDDALWSLHDDVYNILSPICDAGIFAVETNYVARNMHTSLKHAEAIGAIIVAAKRLGWQVVRVSPKEAKRALTGSGSADKGLMVQMADRLFGGDCGKPMYWREAVADAIGVALAGEKTAVRYGRRKPD